MHTQSLLALQKTFKENLPQKISQIEVMWLDLFPSDQHQDKANFIEIHLAFHNLVGTSGTFGAEIVSLQAREIEQVFSALLSNDLSFNDDTVTRINLLLDDLKEKATSWQPSTIPYLAKSMSSEDEGNSAQTINVVLVEDDVELASPLIEKLESQGYQVYYYRQIDDFEADYKKLDYASVIIMDMAFKEGQIAGAETIKRLSEKENNFPPVVFISVHENITARLAAAHVGAKKYFTKPLNHKKLLATLDTLTKKKETEKYRVLIVDDEEEILEYYSNVLQNNGLDVLALRNPLLVYDEVHRYKPELILLDLYMKECSGFDLAQVIRQNDDFAYIPIVFLSSELDVATQLAAMDLGGDDFLMKPVDPNYFSQSIFARVKRARTVRNLNNDLKNTLLDNKYQLITLDQHAFVSMADIKGNITFVNNHFLNISGYSEEDLIGENHRVLKSGRHPKSFYQSMWDTIISGKVWHGQICNKSKNDEEFWFQTTIVPFLDEDGMPYKYVSVRTDITKAKLAEEASLQAEIKTIQEKNEAERSLNAKSSFLSHMSHELRTPMNAIYGFAQMLKMNDAEIVSDEQKNNIEEIIKASSDLLTLIDDILNLSKMEAGQLKISTESLDYVETVMECLAMIEPLMNEKTINLKVQLEGKDISYDELYESNIKIKADKKRIKEVLLNLLSNAVKYNKHAGNITVNFEKPSASFTRLSITDTGSGIATNLLSQLFTAFNRLNEEHSQIEGSGIGLMIAKNMTELMHGRIGVESEVGKGSTFWVEIPSQQ